MILVTGASGFLGQHLLCLLGKEQAPVRALYYNTPPPAAADAMNQISWMQCDLLDIFAVEEAFEGITEVYHCAAQVSFDAEDKYRIQRINRDTTANVVNAALDAGVRKMVFVSSVATLGRGNLDKPLTEKDFWEESNNNTAYARSKYLSEMEVWRGMAEGLNAVIVNPAVILGAGNWQKGSARLISLAEKEFPFYTEGVNGWVDAADVTRAMLLLMRSDITNERFILSEGNYSYREIFTLMAQALAKKPPHIRTPSWASSLLWRWNALRKWLTGKPATLTRETTRTAQMKCFYDNSKFLEAFPDFRYTPLAQTIHTMAAAYRGS